MSLSQYHVDALAKAIVNNADGLSDTALTALHNRITQLIDQRQPKVLVVCELNDDHDPEDNKSLEFLMSLACPECFGPVAEHDVAVRWNNAEFADDGTNPTRIDVDIDRSGAYDADGWICTVCMTALADPENVGLNQPVTINYV